MGMNQGLAMEQLRAAMTSLPGVAEAESQFGGSRPDWRADTYALGCLALGIGSLQRFFELRQLALGRRALALLIGIVGR